MNIIKNNYGLGRSHLKKLEQKLGFSLNNKKTEFISKDILLINEIINKFFILNDSLKDNIYLNYKTLISIKSLKSFKKWKR